MAPVIQYQQVVEHACFVTSRPRRLSLSLQRCRAGNQACNEARVCARMRVLRCPYTVQGNEAMHWRERGRPRPLANC